jgi:hypothetical protein
MVILNFAEIPLQVTVFKIAEPFAVVNAVA